MLTKKGSAIKLPIPFFMEAASGFEPLNRGFADPKKQFSEISKYFHFPSKISECT
jgi:hypothetical protein